MGIHRIRVRSPLVATSWLIPALGGQIKSEDRLAEVCQKAGVPVNLVYKSLADAQIDSGLPEVDFLADLLPKEELSADRASVIFLRQYLEKERLPVPDETRMLQLCREAWLAICLYRSVNQPSAISSDGKMKQASVWKH